MSKNKNYRIDNLQYCNWSKEIFQFNREAGLDAIHVTIAYHEDYDEVQENFYEWKEYFQNYSELIFQGKSFKDIEKAKDETNNHDIQEAEDKIVIDNEIFWDWEDEWFYK